MATPNPKVRSDLLRDPSAQAFRLLVNTLPLDHGAWSAIPEVALRLTMRPEAEVQAESPWSVWPRTFGRGVVKGSGPQLSRIGPFVFVSTSVQTDRILRPIRDQLRNAGFSKECQYAMPALTPAELVAAWAKARREVATFRTWFRSHLLAEPYGLLEELVKVAIIRQRTLRARFESDGVRVLIVASQHNASTRAMLSAVNSLGRVSTCYVPHAPVADDSQYRDLPVHFALLRGPAEVDFYQSIGVKSRERLRSVGLPGHQVASCESIPFAEHFVYAASPRAVGVLRADVDVIRAAVDGPVEVCLHPRCSTSTFVGIFPADWRVHPPGPTMPFLWERGARAVIQHGSGLGLEAMASGAEVIDLCAPGEDPPYPYLARPHAQIVGDSVGLSSAVDALDSRASSGADRREFARSWMSVTDTPASVRAADELLRIAENSVPEGVLLDGWRTGSAVG